jgi:anti-sigma B factor antagonist
VSILRRLGRGASFCWLPIVQQVTSLIKAQSRGHASPPPFELLMAEFERIVISEIGDVTVVRFVDRKIIDVDNIQQLGDELMWLVEQEGRRSLLLNFAGVEFLSSAALNKLVVLERKVRAAGGRWKICCLRTEIHEVFTITRLDRLFDIRADEAEALKAF